MIPNLRGLNKIRILNVDILSISKSFLLENLNEGVLITPNIDHLYQLQHDREFYECYKKADWIICDSRVLYLTSKFFGHPIIESISGSSFFPEYCEYHKNDETCKIFIVGGLGHVSQVAMSSINRNFKNNIVVGAYSPSYGFEKNDDEIRYIIDVVNKSHANVVLVGLGAPKQEKFIMKYKGSMPSVKLWMALGATIDYEAGSKKRAPRWMQKIALEWFYRLLCEPRRLFRRYIINDTRFFWYFFKQLLGMYHNPYGENYL